MEWISEILWIFSGYFTLKLGQTKRKKKWFSAPETKGVWVFHAFCTWWSCEELATHPSAAKKISSKKTMEDLLDFQISEASKTSAKAEPKSLQFIPIWDHLFSHCLQHHQELDPPSCLATFCDIGGRRFVLRWGSPERLEPQKAGKKRPTNQDRPLKKLELKRSKVEICHYLYTWYIIPSSGHQAGHPNPPTGVGGGGDHHYFCTSICTHSVYIYILYVYSINTLYLYIYASPLVPTF